MADLERVAAEAMVPARAAAAGVPGDVACRSPRGADGWVVAAVVAALKVEPADTEAVPEQVVVTAMAEDEQSSFHRATGIRGATCVERGWTCGSH